MPSPTWTTTYDQTVNMYAQVIAPYSLTSTFGDVPLPFYKINNYSGTVALVTQDYSYNATGEVVPFTGGTQTQHWYLIDSSEHPNETFISAFPPPPTGSGPVLNTRNTLTISMEADLIAWRPHPLGSGSFQTPGFDLYTLDTEPTDSTPKVLPWPSDMFLKIRCGSIGSSDVGFDTIAIPLNSGRTFAMTYILHSDDPGLTSDQSTIMSVYNPAGGNPSTDHVFQTLFLHSDGTSYEADFAFRVNSLTFRWVNEVYCTPPAGGGGGSVGDNGPFSATDIARGNLAFAWIGATSVSGPLHVAAHRSALKHVGAANVGWDITTNLETANASDLGLEYLLDDSLFLCYDLSGSKEFRLNRQFGSSPASTWTAAATPNPAVSRISAFGRSQGRPWRLRALGTQSTADIIEFSYCLAPGGANWSTPITAIASALGPWCGGAFLETGFGVLYTNGAGHLYWKTTANPDVWSMTAGTDTGIMGQVVGLTRLASGTLVGLLWDTSANTTKAVRSRNGGQTWEVDSAAIAAIPTLTTPPALCSYQNVAFAVWAVGTQPYFAASQDSGTTWT